jgi:hypothetical protein
MIIFHSGGDRSPFPFDACTLLELLRWLLEGVDLWGAREGVTDCDASLRGRPLAGFSMGALSYGSAAPTTFRVAPNYSSY